MNILHFVRGKLAKERANGVNQVVSGLAKYLNRSGARVRIIGIAQNVVHEGEEMRRDGFYIQVFSGWNRLAHDALVESIEWADIVHLHGTYSIYNIVIGRMCHLSRTPYILTPHNGLSYSQKKIRSFYKKTVFHFVFQRKFIDQAAGIHVLSEEEETDVLSCAQPKDVFCLPNGIDLDDFPCIFCNEKKADEVMRLGFLGRISKEKNLKTLCNAFLRVDGGNSLEMRIGGVPENDEEFFRVIRSSQRIDYIGPCFGESKRKFLKTLDLFIIPSLTEGFPIVFLECLALGVPVLVTRTSKVCYLYDTNVFFMCEPTEIGLERGIRRALRERGQWLDMANRGRELVESRLNWEYLAVQMLDQYRRLM